MYYNTNKMKGEGLTDAREKAMTQEELIFALFVSYRILTPSQIHSIFSRWPLTSIRRAITDLTSAGKLVKTDRMLPGEYGKPEHVWAVAGEPVAVQMDLI